MGLTVSRRLYHRTRYRFVALCDKLRKRRGGGTESFGGPGRAAGLGTTC